MRPGPGQVQGPLGRGPAGPASRPRWKADPPRNRGNALAPGRPGALASLRGPKGEAGPSGDAVLRARFAFRPGRGSPGAARPGPRPDRSPEEVNPWPIQLRPPPTC